MKHLNLYLLATCVLLTGCFTIKTVNISQKTSLEHQLMGSFEPLTEEEMLVGTVRDEASLLHAQDIDLNQIALQARRRQLFNRDDVNAFKKQGCLGEAVKGQLIIRSCSDMSAEQQKLLEQIVEQETQDRESIITWVISQHDHLQESHREQVIDIYRQFILSRSPKGTLFQSANGIWEQKDTSATLQ